MSAWCRSCSFGDYLYKPLNDQLWADTYRTRLHAPWLPTEMVNVYFRPGLVIPRNLAYGRNAINNFGRSVQNKTATRRPPRDESPL